MSKKSNYHLSIVVVGWSCFIFLLFDPIFYGWFRVEQKPINDFSLCIDQHVHYIPKGQGSDNIHEKVESHGEKKEHDINHERDLGIEELFVAISPELQQIHCHEGYNSAKKISILEVLSKS